MTQTLEQARTLVVRCPNWVGDIVMATPVFACLRANLPQTRILGVLKTATQGILRDSPWFDGFVDGNDKSWVGIQALRRQLRRTCPDAGILLTNSLRSALTMRLGGVKTLYGYRRDWRDLLLTGGPTPTRNGGGFVPIPMVEYYLEICRWLGLRIPDSVKPRLFVGPSVRERAERLLERYDIRPGDVLVGLNPGASFGSSKCWPPEYFAEVADSCRNHLGAKVAVFAGPGEEAIMQAIMDRATTNLINLRPQEVDLELLKPLVQRCNLMITNDTGTRHYAVAFDVPVVVIMGPTDPRHTASTLDRTTVVRKELDCSPCHKKVCPKQHECMREISPAEVFAAAEALLKAHA